MSQHLLLSHVSEGSEQQLNQEALNATESVPNLAFPPAVEGMTELQLSQNTGKQPMGIPLAVSMPGDSSLWKAGKEEAVCPLTECLSANTEGEVGSTLGQGLSTARRFWWVSASPTLLASNCNRGTT